MYTKTTTSHGLTVGDLREFMEAKGKRLPDEFKVTHNGVRDVDHESPDETFLMWVEYAVEG